MRSLCHETLMSRSISKGTVQLIVAELTSGVLQISAVVRGYLREQDPKQIEQDHLTESIGTRELGLRTDLSN